MPDKCNLLYDTKRLPLFIRLPFLLFGILYLLLLVDILGDWLFGLPIFGLKPKASDRVFFVVLLSALSIGVIQLWYGRKRILWDAIDECLIIKDRLLFWDTQQRIARAQISSIQIRSGSIRSRTFWYIYACEFTAGETRLIRIGNKEKASEIAERIARAIDRPTLN